MRSIILRLLFILTLPLRGEELLDWYSSILSSKNGIEVNVGSKIEPSYQVNDNYEYLVFVFMNAVNDLGIANMSINDINEMEMVGSTKKVAVVVEHRQIISDRGNISFGVGTDTYFIFKDTENSSRIISPVISHTSDGDMGSARHFAISAKKAIKRFKPEKLIIILWNHGNGYFGISYDDVTKNSMSIHDVKNALYDISKFYGRRIDIFAMDACLMQMAEVIAEVKDYVDYVVASEEVVPFSGYPYDDVLNVINSAKGIRDVAVGIVDAYHNAYFSNKSTRFGKYYGKNITLSAIETSKYDKFIKLLNEWVLTAFKSKDLDIITSEDVKEKVFFFIPYVRENETVNLGVNQYLTSESEGVMTRSADLVDYLEVASSKMTDEELKNKTNIIMNFIKDSFVIHHQALEFQTENGLSYKKRTHGLAIYLPRMRYNSAKYEPLTFAKESLWDEFLRKDFSGSSNKEHLQKQSFVYDEEITTTTLSDSNRSSFVLKPISKLSANFDGNSMNSSTQLSFIESKKNNNPVYQNSSKQNDVNLASSKNSSFYQNIYSTIYTSQKTLKPDIALLNKSNNNIKEDKKETNGNKNASFVDLLVSKINKLKGGILKSKEKEASLELLNKYEVEISSHLSVLYSKKLVENKQLQEDFLKIDSARASKIIGYANIIVEIAKVMSKHYAYKDVNMLNAYLSDTLDRSKPICSLGICVPPENFITRFLKANGHPYNTDLKLSLVRYAIRQWDSVFSNDSMSFEWSQAGIVRVSSQTWLNMSVKERNAVIDTIIKYQIEHSTSLKKVRVNFSPQYAQRVEEVDKILIAVDKITKEFSKSGFLSLDEIEAIKNRPIEEQAYILANLFDRGGITQKAYLKKEVAIINANRTSFVDEVLDEKTRLIFANYISNNIKNELSSSKTASLLYNKLYSNKTPQILVEHLDGRYSSNKDGKIIIDASVIEQYMRIKGYKASDLKDEKVRREIMTYISPLVVKEMAKDYIESSLGDYSPEVREKYAVALLYQARFVNENSKKLNEIMKDMYGFVDYADQIRAVLRIYKHSDNNDEFIQKVGLRYYSNLSSANQARGEMLFAITKEIERRSKMNEDERNRIDKLAIFDENDIYSLSPSEVVNHIDSFTTKALFAFQRKLLSDTNFVNLYNRIVSVL